jgi:hypothetical protein
MFLGSGRFDELGTLNGFRELMELYIKQEVQNGNWFTVCHQVDDSQIDLMKLQGDDGVKLGSVLADTYKESMYRVAIYKYLLRNFLCYVEVPKIRQKEGIAINSFDKVLATSNIDVVRGWLQEGEVSQRHITRLSRVDLDLVDSEFPYLKCNESKGVRSVSVPKKDIDLCVKGIRVIPVFMLKAGVDTLYSKLSDGYTKVVYLKDNGQKRQFTTTTSRELIKDIYGDSDYFRSAVDESYTGDFLNNPTLSRGYIRAVEIGGSKYAQAVKAINYARIVSIEYGVEPDLSFVNIDLKSVTYNFERMLMDKTRHLPSIKSELVLFGLASEKEIDGYGISDLVNFVETKEIVLTTLFQQDLAMFMLMHPQWFPNYTGEKAIADESMTGDVGIL